MLLDGVMVGGGLSGAEWAGTESAPLREGSVWGPGENILYLQSKARSLGIIPKTRLGKMNRLKCYW